MGLPRTLMNFLLYNEGLSHVGEAKTITLPVLSRKIEEWDGGGMGGAVGIDMGADGLLEMSHSYGGPMRQIFSQYGITKVNGVYLRFVGSYQQQDSDAVDAIEVVVRGRHKEIDMGDQEKGGQGEFKVSSVLSYYKLSWNNEVLIEIDRLNMIEAVDGVDRLAAQRAALGMF
ncbi:phage major tail tube protein [Sphingobium cloacae]|uniref:Phage P2 FII-like protein n=1 Tax=Sphingobium cloacae TaxID=120107 RepID=A0A1E1F5Q0_9SPHN|nr:phage major tail tube protein [Sphingobium cloacae]BAV65751.1 phage P2 FII-like protein [Sphingobium cloacae]